jgi:hypothetical protein
LDAIAAELIERETILGEDVRRLISQSRRGDDKPSSDPRSES